MFAGWNFPKGTELFEPVLPRARPPKKTPFRASAVVKLF